MSGCGCGQPVIVNGTQAPARVDVETLLMCDVLPDGTVAGLALVEPVYDTNSGDRIATRTVDPATGAAYVVQGTLQQCPESGECPACETVVLCDAAEAPTSTAALTATGYQVRADQQISGAPRLGTNTDAEAIWAGQPVTVPGAAPGGADAGAHTHYGVILGAGDAACGDLDPTGTVEITATVTYTNDGPGGGWDYYGRLSMWDGFTLLPTVDNFGQGSGVSFPAGSTRTATITNTVPVASLLAGDVTVEFDLETGTDNAEAIKTWSVTGGALTIGPVPVTGCSAGTSTPFLRHICRACDGTATITDTTLDGLTPYTAAGNVGVCGGSSTTAAPLVLGTLCYDDGTGAVRTAAVVRDGTAVTYVDVETGDEVTAPTVVPCPPADSGCASPTTPVTSVGLCLADGTPIAVTVIRDCDGVVTSEGWLNLITGAYTAGAVPVGTIACGDSQSIQVSGTFCDVDAAGEVVGLVLVEYTYDETGAIASVRLVDAVTGATYVPTGTVTVCPAGVEQPEQDAVILCDVAADGTSTQFLRDYRRDETGAITAHSDYTLDGVPYVPTGTVGLCEPETCRNCETLLLCDDGADDAALITGTVSSGALSNGVTWQATGPAPFAPQRDNADGSWWGLGSFPNPVTPNTTWTFNRPVDVEFSVIIRHAGGTGPTDNTAQIPFGAEVVSLPDGYVYDPTTRILSADATVTDCAILATPSQAAGARFRLTNPVTSFSLRYLGARVANCGQFGNWYFGAITVTSSGQFLRTICRDCTGTVVSTTDTALDGTTPYTLLGVPGLCQDTSAEPPVADVEPLLLCDTDTAGTVTQFLRHYVYDGSTGALDSYRDTGLDGSTPYAPSTGGTVGQCQPAACELTPICVRPSGRVEFLSNPAGDTSGVDADWTWGQSLAGPWFPTYRVGVYPGWTTVDPGTVEGTAHWIAPHPDSQLANTGQPGEGPAITAGTPDWYGRASFALPSFADPATIRISATALNADQLAVEWRLNGGAWQPVNSNHTQPPYTLAPTAVPGAQAGLNEIVVHVQETVFPSGAAGILLHVIAEYDVDATAYLQWTQVVCTDGALYFLDELGARQDAIPDGATIVPCPGTGESCAKTVIERCGCDDTDADGLGDETYTELWAVDPCGGEAPELLGTYLDGDLTQPYTPVAPVECTAAEALPGPLSTGVRAVTGTAAQDIAAAFPGLQSVSLTVLAGTVNATMSDGTAVPIPAGATMTWSVAQDSDTALAAASFAGAAAGASYLLNWTWK